jgi:hypothetical protein
LFIYLDSQFLKAVELSRTYGRRGNPALPSLAKALLPQRPRIQISLAWISRLLVQIHPGSPRVAIWPEAVFLTLGKSRAARSKANPINQRPCHVAAMAPIIKPAQKMA